MSSISIRSVVASLAFLFLFLFAPPAARCTELPTVTLNKVRSATVFIKVTRPGQQGRGSGFLVSPEIIVTNAHVLGVSEDDETLPDKVEVVFHSGSSAESVVVAEVNAVDVPRDLAFLKVPRQAGVHSLSLRPSDEITETLPVYILGFPLGEGLDLNGRNPSITISSGHVSSLRRDAEHRIDQIQIDGSLIPGNSGGPIIDSKGELVAVSASAILGLNIGFSIPGDTVKADLDGRIDTASFQYIAVAGGAYSVKASVTTVDPLSRIKRLALYYWTSPLDAQRPIDPQGKFGTYGAPGDGPRKHIELSFNARDNKWVGEIPKFSLRADQDFWMQPAFSTADGVRRVEAANHGEALREKTAASADSVASARRGAQRSRPPARSTPHTGRAKPESPLDRGVNRGNGNNSNGNNGSAASREIARHFNSQKRPPAPAPVSPPVDLALDASRERDNAGYPYTLATSVASTVSLGSTKLLQMVADPHGDRLYVILQDESKVFVYDPTNMTVKDEILVPREPVSIWCDAERLIVACSESRVIVFIDTQTLKPVKSVRVREAEDWMPQRVVGRTPDGSAMTIWAMPGGSSRTATLYFVGEDGKNLKVITADIEWCAFPNKNLLWTQYNFTGSPSGCSRVISLLNPKDGDAFHREPFGRKGFDMHRSFGHCFPSADGKKFIIPTEGRGLSADAESGYATRTFVAQSDLSDIVMELDGSVFYEYVAGDCYVAWKDGRKPGKPKTGPEIMYHSRSSGRMVRKIVVENFDPHPALYVYRPPVPEVIFVPGQELLLFHDRNDRAANITVIRCGPVLPDADVAADPSMQVENAPPKLAAVGKQLTYTPTFSRPEHAQSIVFRLDQAVSGMEIDPQTGKISFTPTDANLGLYDISIVADVDGIEVPVLTWLLEIDQP